MMRKLLITLFSIVTLTSAGQSHFYTSERLSSNQKWAERAGTYHIAGDGYTDKDLKEYKRDIPAGYYIRPIPQGQLDGMEMEPAEKEAYQNPAYRN
jgi:hypothetical protein